MMSVDANHSELSESEAVICSITQTAILDAQIVDLSIRKPTRYARPRVRPGRSRTPILDIGEPSDHSPPSPVAVFGRTSPRKRLGRSRTPIRERVRDQPADRSSSHSRYKDLGARPKTCKQSASVTVPLDQDTDDDTTEVEVIEGSSEEQDRGDSNLIDLTGQRLPLTFPAYGFESNLGLTRLCISNSDRSTPTPACTPAHNAVQCAEASTSRSPKGINTIPVKEIQCLDLDVHKVLGVYPPDSGDYDGDCDSHLGPDTITGQCEYNSSPETFPTHFKRKSAPGDKKCKAAEGGAFDGDKVSGLFPKSTTDSYFVTNYESLNRVIETVKQDSGLSAVFPRLSKPHPHKPGFLKQKPRKSLLGPPPAEAGSSKEIGPNSRAQRRGLAANKCAARIGKPKNKWCRKLKKKGGSRNVVKNSSWWTGRYLQPAQYHIPGNPRWHLTLRAPPVNLPIHHVVDSAMVSYVEDDHYCGCVYGEQGEANPGSCWCRSSIREIVVKYVVESSVHFNSNEMDIMPDGY